MSQTAVINFRVDARDKKKAAKALEEVGLNMSVYLNMVVKRIARNGAPLVIEREFSPELRKSLKEADEIVARLGRGEVKGYRDMNKLFEALEAEDEE